MVRDEEIDNEPSKYLNRFVCVYMFRVPFSWQDNPYVLSFNCRYVIHSFSNNFMCINQIVSLRHNVSSRNVLFICDEIIRQIVTLFLTFR